MDNVWGELIMSILWNYTGAVTSNSAIAVAKVGYDYGSFISSPKVFTLTYNGDTMTLYIDGEMIEASTKSSAGMSKITQLFIGADYDDTCWYRGLLPEILFFDNALNDTDRIAYTNHLKYKWVTGYNTSSPSITSARLFLEFNENGLVYDTDDRVTGWNDTSEYGGNRSMYIKTGTSLGTREINGRKGLYFDSKTFFTLDQVTGSENNPDNITIMFVAQFEDFDSTPYPDGDGGQSIISSTENDQFRIKKYDSDDYLSYRVRDWDGVTYYLDAPKSKVVTSTLLEEIIGSVELYIGDNPSNLNYYGPTQLADNYNNYGVVKFNLINLQANKEYYGVFSLDSVIDETTRFTFKTLPTGPSSFKIITGSCNRTGSNAVTWDAIKEEKPDLFIHLGDLNYLDANTHIKQEYAKGLDLSMSDKIKSLLRSNGWVYQYDNHDSLSPTPDKNNTAWTPFLEFFTQVHATHTPGSSDPINDGLYYSFTIGRVKCIILDLRRMRDPQRSIDGPDKSILGVNQKQWFKNELLQAKMDSDAVIIFSQILWTADRDNPNGDSFDSWGASWASYPTERSEIANFVYDNQIKNVTMICADVHMQAIDDGRNGCYITDANGDRVDPNTIEKAYWMPMLEASPFDQYLDYDGGPFNINDTEGSGGPTGSSEQSYGVVEVLDTGENWLQFKLYTMAYINGKWERNRYYTYNWSTDNGTPGTPPPLDWNKPDSLNVNGYVFSNNWKPIKNRYIVKDGVFKNELYKWKFIKGKWVKIYDPNTFDDDRPLSVNQINTWTANTENVIEVSGKGFMNISYPPNYGGYYTFGSNAGDLFGNFPYGTAIGTPLYGVIDGVKAVTTSYNNYIMMPNGLGTGLFFNGLFERDFMQGFWIFIDPLKYAENTSSPIITNSTGEYGYFTYRDTSAEIKLRVNLGPDAIITDKILSAGWNKIALNVKASDTGRYTYLYINDNKAEILNFKVKDFGVTEVTPEPIYVGRVTDSNTIAPTIANYYYLPRYAQDSQIQRFILKPEIDIVLTDKVSGDRYIVPQQWRLGLTNTKVSFTLPPDVTPGDYELTIESLNYISNPLPLSVAPLITRSTPFITNFATIDELKDNFYIFHKAWGGANGGVVKENVEHTPGLLKLYANGDLYSGSIQGVNRDGDPKTHTNLSDPNYGKPWTNRVGGVIVYKEKTGFGSYRVKAKIPTILGVCSAFWTFYYNEIYPGDPRWNDFIDDGLHSQGNDLDGYYMTRNHEIDIELPSHLDGGNYAEPSFNNFKANTWRGELQNWDVTKDHPDYWEEYRDNLTPTGVNMYDNQEHEFRFDWYADRVEFYIDGELKRINSGSTIPNIAGHFTFGLWFPSAPLRDKSWLVDPARAWAGGVIDVDGGRKAMFDRVSMDVSEFSYTPFDQNGLNLSGETYPYGTYRKY